MCINCYSDFLKLGLQLGGFFISVFTLVFAYKIYKNFDVKKSFLKEQLKTVYDLSNELYNFGLPTSFISGGSASNYPRFFSFFKQKGIENYQEIYFNNTPIDQILPFTNYQHNILLPKPIAVIIEKFNIPLKYTQIDNLPPKYILIKHIPENQEDKNVVNYYHYMSYNDFHILSIELVSAITKWLGDYGAVDINLPDHMKKQ